jgi:hypothetical protein
VVIRAFVFGLAFLSFACLLGHFYGLWTMHVFACTVLPPTVLILAALAWTKKGLGASVSPAPRRAGPKSPRTWIVEGACAGLIAAVAYDLYRVPFVLNGAPLFKVFPQFGELILAGTQPRWAVHVTGWAYHFSNGAALGIMFLALLPKFTPRLMFWGAVSWALFIEAMLLLTPYANVFGLKMTGQFLFLTASAHLVFGITLGLWCRFRLCRAEGSFAAESTRV